MPPPPDDKKQQQDKPPEAPQDNAQPQRPAQPQHDDGSAGKLLWLAAGAALMWLGGTLHDALNSEEPQNERNRSTKGRKRVSSAWPDSSASSSCSGQAARERTAAESAPYPAESNPFPNLAASSSADERVIPSFLCPITHEIMQDPVSTPYGHSYERAAIVKYAGKPSQAAMLPYRKN
jgi:hypothetical protein